MNTAKLLEPIAVKDYLEGEKTSLVKHEYVHGSVYAMAGASDNHNRIVTNLTGQLYAASNETNCQLYSSDMKARINEEVFYYPDFMVVCEEDDGDYFKSKPCLIVEVLSRSTATTDKREKREAYLKLESLQTYLLIDSESQAVTSYQKTSQGWLECSHESEDDVIFACLNTSLSVSDIYRNISFT